MYCPGAGFPPRVISCPGFLPRVCPALSRVSSERVVSCLGAGFPQWVIFLPWSRVSSEDNVLSWSTGFPPRIMSCLGAGFSPREVGAAFQRVFSVIFQSEVSSEESCAALE
jgi:hypothetical protein